MKIKLHIGLDVHKNSIVVATASEDGSPPQHYGKWGGSTLCSQRGLVKLCKKFGVEKDEIRIAYEAGPTGFVLVRRLLQLGYDCIVVAPSEVPGKAGERVKTDSRPKGDRQPKGCPKGERSEATATPVNSPAC